MENIEKLTGNEKNKKKTSQILADKSAKNWQKGTNSVESQKPFKVVKISLI